MTKGKDSTSTSKAAAQHDHDNENLAVSTPVNTPVSTSVQVQLISVQDKLLLVEWVEEGAAQRVLLEFAAVSAQARAQLQQTGSADVEKQLLADGKQYGAQWEKVISIKTSAADIAVLLRNNGIWTLEDALARPDTVRAVLAAALGLDLSSFFQSIVLHKTETEGE